MSGGWWLGVGGVGTGYLVSYGFVLCCRRRIPRRDCRLYRLGGGAGFMGAACEGGLLLAAVDDLVNAAFDGLFVEGCDKYVGDCRSK